jgi:hypothetical protein
MFGKIIVRNILNHLTAVKPNYLLVACKNIRLRYRGNILQKHFSNTKIPAPRELIYLCSKSHSQKNIYHGITKYAVVTVKFRNLNSTPTPKGKQHTGPCNGAQTLCGWYRGTWEVLSDFREVPSTLEQQPLICGSNLSLQT